MKKLLFIFLGIVFSGQIVAQSDECWALMVRKKGVSDTTILTENYNPNGIYLQKDGIYNFKVHGEQFDMYRITEITEDQITIAFTTDRAQTYSFSPKEIDKVVFYARDEGKIGYPHVNFTSKKYDFNIIECPAACFVEKARIYETTYSENYIEGYNYMTAGYGWKPVYEKNGKVYLLDLSKVVEIER